MCEFSDALSGCEGAAGGAVKRGAAAATTASRPAAASNHLATAQLKPKRRPADDEMGHTSSNLSLMSKKSTGSIDPGSSKLGGNTRLVPFKPIA